MVSTEIVQNGVSDISRADVRAKVSAKQSGLSVHISEMDPEQVDSCSRSQLSRAVSDSFLGLAEAAVTDNCYRF
jgi:acetolactate synthase small subunit